MHDQADIDWINRAVHTHQDNGDCNTPQNSINAKN